MYVNTPRPKKPLLLPKTLSIPEIKRLFEVTGKSLAKVKSPLDNL
jgi:hypothetical protein